MKFAGLGLQGKFVVALFVAAVLPFLVGLVIFESSGYRYLLEERGKLHQMEAVTLVRALNQAADAHGDNLHTWLAADPALRGVARSMSRLTADSNANELSTQTRQLDEIWASLPDDDPRLREILGNPGSASLMQFQKLNPEIAEVLATDKIGRLIAATGKATDFDQADEDWWIKGRALPAGGLWTDVLRFDASSEVFSLDVVAPVFDASGFQGVVKLSMDVSSVFSRLGFDGEDVGERWEIVLPDGWILASSRGDFTALSRRIQDATLEEIQGKPKGWALVRDETGEARMAGNSVGIGEAGQRPNAHIVFSSRRDDVVGPLQIQFLRIGMVAAVLLTLCLLTGFYLIRHNILKLLATLGRAAQSIAESARLRHAPDHDPVKVRQHRERAESELARIEEIRTGDEVEALAKDLAVMTSRVLRYQQELEGEVESKTALIQEDLMMAREFQTALLPSEYPQIPASREDDSLRLQFAHFYQPASTVGGDFFDLIEIDEHRVGVLIADVMGHGARSALITAILRALVRNHAGVASDPGAFLGQLNQHLHEVISRSGQTLFVTAFFLILDTRAGKASWAVAGHPAPMRVRRGSGKVPGLLWDEPQHQLALGLAVDSEFKTTETSLLPGDVFLLFTDGVFEAENPAGEVFGLEKLASSFDQALDGPMAAMPAKIICDVSAFQKRKTYDDDVCLVVVEAAGTGKSGS